MRQYLDLTTWIILFALAPLTILILLSQNAIPGDLFYPVKRGMENVVLAAASVNPSTRVAFRTDLTQRRFQEAQQLLTIKGDTTAFSDFVTEVSTTQQDLSSLSNAQDKLQNSDKLIAKIVQYQNQLEQVQNQVLVAQGQTPNPISTTSPSQTVQNPPPGQATSIPIQTLQPSAQPVTPTTQPSQGITEPTTQPIQNSPISTNQPTEQPVVSTPIPTIQPSAVSVIANNPQSTQEIKNTIKDLKELKDKVEKNKEDAQVEQKVHEDQQKLQEELKKRQENGNKNDH